MNSHISPEQRISVIYNLYQPLHIPTERQRHANDLTNPQSAPLNEFSRARLNKKEKWSPEDALLAALYDLQNVYKEKVTNILMVMPVDQGETESLKYYIAGMSNADVVFYALRITNKTMSSTGLTRE